MYETAVTAGSFLCYRDAFVFQFGPDLTGERLGVVRVGGHVEPAAWDSPEPAPLVVVLGPERAHVSMLYLAQTDDLPQPAAEARGLMFLTPAQVAWLAKARPTLGDLLARGGRVVVREPLPPERVLAPAYHLRVLARIMEQYPNISLGLCPGL